MGQQQQIIYVDGKGFIPIQSGQTVQDAIAAAGGAEPAARPAGATQAVQSTLGLQLPEQDQYQDDGRMADILRSVPQIAGLIASFTPAGRTAKAAIGVPAGAEALMQAIRKAISGEDFDPVEMAAQGGMGLLGKGVGDVVGKVGRGGEGMVRRTLGLTDGDEVLEQEIPKRLIKEKAEMSIPGVAKLREKADATGDPWLKEATDALAKARYKANNSPNLNAGGLMSMAGDALLPVERQMSVGSAAAAPFGVSTEKVIAPTIESAIRSLMAYLSSLGSPSDEPPPVGPRRRSQQ